MRRDVAVLVVALGTLGGCGGDRAGEGPWELRVDGGTSPTAWLRSVGTEGPPGEPQTRSAILSLDCRPDHTGATILTEQALRQGSVELALALDGGEPRTVPGFAGTTPTGGQVALTLPLDSLLDLLAGHQQATIAYEDGAGSSRTAATFPVAGVETHRQAFLAACPDSVRRRSSRRRSGSGMSPRRRRCAAPAPPPRPHRAR